MLPLLSSCSFLEFSKATCFLPWDVPRVSLRVRAEQLVIPSLSKLFTISIWKAHSHHHPFSPPSTLTWDDRSRKEEEKPRQVSIPPVILLFVRDLPVASSLALTGPVFRTDNPWN